MCSTDCPSTEICSAGSRAVYSFCDRPSALRTRSGSQLLWPLCFHNSLNEMLNSNNKRVNSNKFDTNRDRQRHTETVREVRSRFGSSSVFQVISETVVQVFHEFDFETPSRKDVFPQLLKRLGFQDRESEELCRSVDRFYTELFNMHTHGNDTSALSRQAPSMRKRKRE